MIVSIHETNVYSVNLSCLPSGRLEWKSCACDSGACHPRGRVGTNCHMRLPWLGPLLLGQALAILVAMTAVCSVLLVEQVRARAGSCREGVFVTGGLGH